MSYFERSSDTVETGVVEPEYDEMAPEEASERRGLAGFGDRIARAFATLDRGRVAPPELVDGPPVLPADGELAPDEEPAAAQDDSSRFPVAALGYSRGAVDHYVAELEQELAALRSQHEPAISITEEIERLGEQTASILVVAHDQAHETTRLAQEQADRCIADAASNAVSITEDAKRKLREIDAETDAVWQERRRLIEDVRTTATALFALAEDAIDRFPEDAERTVEADVLASEE
jgi:cell division septum initiation protein DivIVA